MNTAASTPVRTDVAPASVAPASTALRWTTAALITLTLAYFFWTTVCSFNEVPTIPPRDYRETDHYNLLSRGFLSGHLYLDAEVPQALLDAPNPYDPKSRGPVDVLHDASFYQGKYYIYFGPAPVLTLFLPFTLITGRDLVVPYAVFLFASGTFLALSATFLTLRRRYFPTSSAWSTAGALIALGGGSLLVALLRRPHIWEVATACGLFYFSLSIYFLIRSLGGQRSRRWALAGGLALGMAVASRPTYIVCSVIFVLPLLLRRWAPAFKSNYSWGSVVAAGIGCTCIVVALLGYNYARFGNLLEFGQKYQLSSIIEGDARHFSLSYLTFNSWVYFLARLRWTDSFPFHTGVAVPPLPEGHGGYEYSIGIFSNLPFSWFAAVAFSAASVWVARRERGELALAIIIAGAIFVLQAGLLLCYFGNCVRYMAEFTPWLMLAASIGVAVLETSCASRAMRVTVRATALAFAIFSLLAAGLSVVNNYNVQNGGETPRAYRPIARFLGYPAALLRRVAHADYRPMEMEITFPSDPSPRQEPLLTVDRSGTIGASVFVDYLGHGKLRLGYREGDSSPLAFSPVIAPPAGSPQRLQISLGTNYADYDGHKFHLRVHLNGWPLWSAPIISGTAFPGHVALGKKANQAFTGTIHSTRQIDDRDFAAAKLGGARLRFTLQPDMAGRSFPLVTSGRRDAGDLLFMRVAADGAITFGYDHWADELRLSAPIPMRFGEEHSVEFWIPAVNRPGSGKPNVRDLVVRLDGVETWRRPAPFFPTLPKTLFVGLNPIGGTTCEAAFTAGVLEETQIAPPETR